MTTDLFADVRAFGDIIGNWTPTISPSTLVPTVFLPVADTPPESDNEHAETHLIGVVVADFAFSTVVKFGSGADAHLQFRISGDGRYGVSLRESGFKIYHQLRKSAWIWEPITPDSDVRVPLAANTAHEVSVTCAGSHISVTVDEFQKDVFDDFIPVGRLGLYAFRSRGSQSRAEFTKVQATTDTAALSNFSLLYSTVGYLAAGCKRALLRSLVALPGQADLQRGVFSVRTTSDDKVIDGSLRNLGSTYGMSLWEADFSNLRTPGVYLIRLDFTVANAAHTLESSPFTIEERVFTRRLLHPLSILNANARNAADVDMRCNWKQVSGNFVVGDEGALWAWNADDQDGSRLERTADGYGGSLPRPLPDGYTMTGEITILEGCDAQLQFGVTPTRRLAVTLQAGAGGRCVHGSGPGAIRLHEEGFEVPRGFRTIDAKLLPSEAPFQPGLVYSIRIVVSANSVTVFLNSAFQFAVSVPVDVQNGGFAIKAWASSVRFDRVAVWRHGVQVEWVLGTGSEFIDRASVPGIGACDGTTVGESSTVECLACSPVFAQRHGFNDCNNYIGESNSHGAFIAGLVEVWLRRRAQLSEMDQRALRRAVITGVSYLGHLFKLAGGTGRYKHEELGRGRGNDVNNGSFLTYLTISGVYGDLSFASRTPDIDAGLASAAMRRAWKGCQWLETQGLDNSFAALFYYYLSVCAGNNPSFAELVRSDLLLPASQSVSAHLQAVALEKANALLGSVAAPGLTTLDTWRTSPRDTGQMIPRLEGVHALRRAMPLETSAWVVPLQTLATQMKSYLLSQNGFHVIPQSSGDVAAQHTRNWDEMDKVPAVANSIADGRSFYNSTFFCTMALEMVFLGQLAGDAELEKLAAGHLAWVLGLNPGIPANKALNSSPSGPAWKSAAFIQNLDAPFARGFENDTPHLKSWLWGGEDKDLNREVWFFEPLENGFRTIVNGHVLYEGNWDYYNTGEHGWISGETFMLNDGIYARASIAYEDWVAGKPEPWMSLGTHFISAVAIANQDGRLEIIAPRQDNTIVNTWEKSAGGQLADWHFMDGYVLQPFGILNLDGRMELFGRGSDGALWHRWQVHPNGPFDHWHTLEGSLKNAAVARNADGRIEIFAAFRDGTIHHRWQVAPNQYFDAWHSLDGSGDHPKAGTNGDGRLELFILGSDLQLYHRWQTAPNAYFDSWHSLGGELQDLTVARNHDQRMEVFAVSIDNEILHRWQVGPNQYFDDWHSLGGSFISIDSVELGDGRIELFAVGTDHAVWRNVQTAPNSPFIGWECLGSSAESLSVGIERDGRAVLLVVQTNGQLWFLRQPSIGTWLRAASE